MNRQFAPKQSRTELQTIACRARGTNPWKIATFLLLACQKCRSSSFRRWHHPLFILFDPGRSSQTFLPVNTSQLGPRNLARSKPPMADWSVRPPPMIDISADQLKGMTCDRKTVHNIGPRGSYLFICHPAKHCAKRKGGNLWGPREF